MTEANSTDNIETLASRAKEMLERVRGAADPDALTPPPLPLSTSLDNRGDEESDVEEIERSDSESNDDAEDIELVELDENERLELDADDDGSEADDQDSESDGGETEDVEPETAIDDTKLDDVELDDIELDDTGTEDAVTDELETDDSAIGGIEIVADGEEITIDEVELAEPLTSSADLDHADNADTDTDAEVDVDAELDVDDSETNELEDLEDPSNAEKEGEEQDVEDAASDASLNLFGRKDERDSDEAELVDSDGVEFTPEDISTDDILLQDDLSEDADFDASGDADSVIADLEELEALPVDPNEEFFDLVEEEPEVEGVSYLGDTNLDDAPSISTDDLIVDSDDEIVEQSQEAVGLDLDSAADDDAEVDEVDEPSLSFKSKPKADGLVTGEAVVAGSAIAGAAAASSEETKDAPVDETRQSAQARRRGRLSDLGPKEEVAPQPQSQSRGRFSRKPAVDHDLNDLFLKSNSPDQATAPRSFPWLVPLGLIIFAVLAIFVLFTSWWFSGSGTDSTSTDATEQVETNDSTNDTVEEDTPTTAVPDETPTTVAVAEAPDTTVEEPEATTTFDSAADLIGAGSSTGDLAELGSSIGLEQALEQFEVDENGDLVRFTLLAPSDAAIAKLSNDQLADLADPANAEALIQYHFIDEELTPEFLQQSVGGEIMTRAGVPISVELDGDDYVFNGEARVEIAGLDAENGSVIVIDTVLMAPTTAAAIEDVLDLRNVQFQTFQDVITDEGKAELANAVAFFNENPDVTAIIGGHTDSDGPADGNQRLSQRRANAVRQFLIDAGIDGSRLEAQGFGEEQPVLDSNGVEDKDASRRIEFVLN